MTVQLFIVFIGYCIILFLNHTGRYDHISKGFIISFQTIWAGVLVVSCFRPLSLYLPDPSTYAILLSGIISFTFGFILIKIPQHSKLTFPNEAIQRTYYCLTTNKLFLIVLLFGTAYVIHLFSIFWERLAISNLADVRKDFFYDNFYGREYVFLNPLLLWPLFYYCLPLFVYGCFYRKKPILILMFVFIIVNSSLSGGRFDYLQIIFSLLFFIVCLQKLNKKRILVLVSNLLIFFCLISIVTAARLGSKGNATELMNEGFRDAYDSVVTYACGSVVAFDHALKNDYVGKLGGYQFGTITSSGIIQGCNMVTKRLGIQFKEPIQDVGKLKQEQYIMIGSNHSFNALYTGFFFFYLDFGVFGVILIPMMFGMFVRLCIRKLYFKKNIYLLVLLNLFYVISMLSITDFFGAASFAEPLFIFTLLLIGTYNKNIRIKLFNLNYLLCLK